jgi:hypothetical protein
MYSRLYSRLLNWELLISYKILMVELLNKYKLFIKKSKFMLKKNNTNTSLIFHGVKVAKNDTSL